jgi:hypothetical protein
LSYSVHATASPPHAGSVKTHPSWRFEQAIELSLLHAAGAPVHAPAVHEQATAVHDGWSRCVSQLAGTPEQSDE